MHQSSKKRRNWAPAAAGLLVWTAAGCGMVDPGADTAEAATEQGLNSHSGCSAEGYYHLYLDGDCNGERIKTYPDKHEGGSRAVPNDRWRDWQCPNRGPVPSGYLPASASLDAVKPQIDYTALADMNLPRGLNLTVINIKRDRNGDPFYRYFRTRSDAPRESWSASKFMGVAAAGARIRRDSYHMVGLDSKTASGEYVGDLVTWIHNYSRHGKYASNSLAKYFFNVAGRDFAQSLMQDWVGSPGSSLGANYGASTYGISYTFDSLANGRSKYVKNTGTYGGHKSITTLASAEFLKRLVMHREDPVTRMPGFRADKDAAQYWKDLEILFYGKPGWYWGGMQDDTAIYLESAVDIDAIQRRAPGEWRIFSKLGRGNSNSRGRAEFVYTGYGCFPHNDKPSWGKEFVVAAHYSLPKGTYSADTMDRKLARAIDEVSDAIMDGRIDQMASPPPAGRLFDIDGHWAERQIRALADAGVVSGYTDGSFKPDNTLTRAEFATLVDNAFSPSPKSRCRDRSFTDVERDDWFYPHVMAAARSCFIAGFRDGSFKPAEPLTKTQMYVVLANGLDLHGGSTSQLGATFSDAGKIPDWAKGDVADALANRLVLNFPYVSRMEPRAKATRAEAATAIYQGLRGQRPADFPQIRSNFQSR